MLSIRLYSSHVAFAFPLPTWLHFGSWRKPTLWLYVCCRHVTLLDIRGGHPADFGRLQDVFWLQIVADCAGWTQEAVHFDIHFSRLHFEGLEGLCPHFRHPREQYIWRKMGRNVSYDACVSHVSIMIVRSALTNKDQVMLKTIIIISFSKQS